MFWQAGVGSVRCSASVRRCSASARHVAVTNAGGGCVTICLTRSRSQNLFGCISLPSRSFGTARHQAAHVLAIATEIKQETLILQRCADRLGYTFQAVGLGEPWVGFGTKLVQYHRALKTRIGKDIAPDDFVLLIDAYDTMLIGPAEEFLQKMSGAPYASHPLWYAGERIIGPDFALAPRVDAIYPDPKTPWRYPNAGAMCGVAENVFGLMGDLLRGSQGVEFPEDGNDQARLHEHLLELAENASPAPFRVDSTCGIFQCLYEAEPQWDLVDEPLGSVTLPRLRNRLTDECPIVLHGNGHTGRWFMTGLWREMKLLRRLGLRPGDLSHLAFDGPVAPGTVPDEDTRRNWAATFQLYRMIEMQAAQARVGVEVPLRQI